MGTLYIEQNVAIALQIVNGEFIYIVKESQNPTKLVFTREIDGEINHKEGYIVSKIKEIVIFRKKKVLGIKLLESLFGYNYFTFKVSYKYINKKYPQLIIKKNKGVLVVYVR